MMILFCEPDIQAITIPGLWKWLQEDFPTALTAKNYYGMEGGAFAPIGERGLVGDHINRLLGHSMIRQVRAKPGERHFPNNLKTRFGFGSFEFC